MDTFDFDDLPQPRRNLDLVWNVLTVAALLSVLGIAAGFVMIFTDPQTAFNPFPPPTMPAALQFPTPTETPRGVLPPTWTPTATLEPTATETPRPTLTPQPTDTPLALPSPTETQTPGPTVTRPSGGYPFVVKNGGPIAIPNIAYPNLGCNWMGVGGQVFDMSGGPKTQLIVILGGSLNGKSLHPSGVLTSLTGVASQYGQAGYEFLLGDQPAASKGSLWVQLVDQSDIPLSDRVYFDTYEDCDKNLILVNFSQVR